MKKKLYITALLFMPQVYAQVTMLEQLNFGKLVISSNQTASSLTLLPSNTNSFTNHITLLEKGHVGQLLLEGFPARIQINVSDLVSEQSLNNTFGGPPLVLNRLIYNSPVLTNSLGTALLRVGGQISTTGDGRSYNDGNYNTTVEVEISF